MARPIGTAELWPDGPPRHRHLADLARAGIATRAGAPGVVHRDRSWTHREIGGWSARIAAAIDTRIGSAARRHDHRDGQCRIGLCVRRGPGLVAGIVGIVEAGCSFVPVDPAHPVDRVRTILADCAPDLVLSDDVAGDAARLGLPVSRFLNIAALERGPPVPGHDVVLRRNPNRARNGDAEAYVLYTSGSTGAPKGVMCNHLGICNLVEDRLAAGGFGGLSRLLLTTSIAFDAAIYDIFLALGCGACLVIAAEADCASSEALADLMQRAAVTHADMTPSLFAALPDVPLPALRAVSLGGETCPDGLIATWAARVALDNCYGPTEAAVEVTRWRWAPGEPGNRIGRPIRNVRLAVVDAAGAPADEGELWIAGPMLALGYLGMPEATAERFVVAPETGTRFYRTGDRVRRIGPDIYEFLGRTDDQVKISGVRIEPEEVRRAIEALPGVAQAAVAVEEGAHGRVLVGFYRRAVGAGAGPGNGAGDAAGADRSAMMERLGRRLPGAMLPARLIEVDELPLAPSGKIDLGRLRQHVAAHAAKAPAASAIASANMAAAAAAAVAATAVASAASTAVAAPAAAAAAPPAAAEPPRSDVARQLEALWCKLLNRPAIRSTDNFFELGGDSLRLTELIYAINKTFRIRLTPSRYRTLEDFRALVAFVETAIEARG